MAFDSAHVLLTWGGKLPGGETWTNGIRLCEQLHVPGSATIGPQADIRSWLNGSLQAAVRAFHTRPFSAISASAVLSFAKAARIGTDGRYMDQTTDEFVYPDVPGGGGAGAPNPAQQIALAISLTTGYTRGPAHRGRFYMPMPITPPQADGLIAVADAAGVQGSVKTFLEALADVPGIDAFNSYTPTVMSRRGGGAHRAITGVEVGRVLDTQRRRRRSLPEKYGHSALNLGAH